MRGIVCGDGRARQQAFLIPNGRHLLFLNDPPKMVHRSTKDAIKAKISTAVDTSEMEERIEALRGGKSQNKGSDGG